MAGSGSVSAPERDSHSRNGRTPQTRLIIVLLILVATTSAAAADTVAVEAVLDGLHRAASQADGETYFALFAEHAVFIGTDATERWTIDAFRDFATPYFDSGKGWTYTVTERHVAFSRAGDTAWFDEILDNASYGTCRGTGVLIREGTDWRIAQYHLTIPIPNELSGEVVTLIRELEPEPR